MKKYKNNLNNKGVALLTVVLVFMVLVILLGGVMFSSVTNQKNSLLTNRHTSAYYAAESGLNIQIEKFNSLFDTALSAVPAWSLVKINSEIAALITQINTVDNLVSFSDIKGEPSTATILIGTATTKPGMAGYDFYPITSTGSVGNVERIVYSEIGIRYTLTPGTLNVLGGAVITDGSINVQNGKITGPIASNLSSPTDRIDLKSCSNITTISVISGSESDVNDCKSKVDNLESTIMFKPIALPDYSTTNALSKNIVSGVLNLTGSTATYDNKTFTISNFTNPTGTLTIKIDGADENERFKLIVTGNHSITGNINVEGKGRLLVMANYDRDVYLNAKIRYKQGTTYLKDATKLNLVLKDMNNTKYNLSVGVEFNGTVLTNSAPYINWNNVLYGGYLITNSTSITIKTPNSSIGSPTSPIWIYAPNANYEMQANMTFYGSIMTKTFYMNSSSTEVIYTSMNAIYPFMDWTPLPFTVDDENATATLERVVMPFIEN